jgi:DNA-binding NtrC family response regulator
VREPPIPDQTTTLTDDGQLGTAGDQGVLCLRWCHPLPALPPLELGAGKWTLGRDPSCDVTLASGHVSRVHAEIRRTGPIVVVSDLGSKNGISVNGKRVPQAVLNAGDVLRIGDQVGVVVNAAPGSDLGYASFASSISGGHRHRAVTKRARELAASPLPIVLEGATGTGKELMARAVHEWSERSGPFLAVNSAIYSRTMAAAELFGFKKGAFTGAEHSSPGHVRAAHGGTLFLDEILELSLEVQAMLLRTLELREVLPLGETRALPVDVRFVVATQTPLAEAVAAGRFRADLRARLEGAIVKLPRLAECREIVPELLGQLYARRRPEAPLELSAAAAEALCIHGWPLNVRELDMLAGRLAARSVPARVEVNDLELGPDQTEDPGTRQSTRPAAATVPGRRPSGSAYDEEELEQLRAALERHAGNVSRAVAELGITRQRAYRMLGLLKQSG